MNGREHGKWIGYHANGEKKYEGSYANGLQEGKWTYYNKKGVKNLDSLAKKSKIHI